jgi:4-hydroxy-3-methylbut-2-enyl diphosphate reductase IspH
VGISVGPEELKQELIASVITSCPSCVAQEEKYRAARSTEEQALSELGALASQELIWEQLSHALTEGTAANQPITMSKATALQYIRQKHDLRGKIKEQEEEIAVIQAQHESSVSLHDQTTAQIKSVFTLFEACKTRLLGLDQSDSHEKLKQSTTVLESKLSQATSTLKSLEALLLSSSSSSSSSSPVVTSSI